MCRHGPLATQALYAKDRQVTKPCSTFTHIVGTNNKEQTAKLRKSSHFQKQQTPNTVQTRRTHAHTQRECHSDLTKCRDGERDGYHVGQYVCTCIGHCLKSAACSLMDGQNSLSLSLSLSILSLSHTHTHSRARSRARALSLSLSFLAHDAHDAHDTHEIVRMPQMFFCTHIRLSCA